MLVPASLERLHDHEASDSVRPRRSPEVLVVSVARSDHAGSSVPSDVNPRLASAVRRGVEILSDLRAARPDIDSGALERALRHEVGRLLDTRREASGPLVAAVRAACAHLHAGDYEEAHLALLTAESLVPRRPASAVENPT